MYAPLKITTDYSLLKSLIKIEDLISFLVDHNIDACAIVDENLFGSLDFYLQCTSHNIKPIIGLAIFFNGYEIYLYAKNYEGYKALLKLHTIKDMRDVAIVDLEKYHDDLLIIVPFKSRDIYKTLSNFLVYLGYENEYEKRNSKLITTRTIYVNDIRCLKMENLGFLNYLDLLDERGKNDYAHNYYDATSSIVDTEEIKNFVAQINLEIPFNKRYIPKYKTDASSSKFLQDLTHKGLYKRLLGKITPIYQKRLEYELSVIEKMDFVDYFLIVYDYVLYAKKNNILVNCRGSAAGSLVSYCLGITDIDPIKYGLMFERFLNPDRVTMPDIDMDFDAEKRDMVITYVKNKYGLDKVAGGITFATLKSKLVLRDCAKVLNIDANLFNNFIKHIDSAKTLKENLTSEVVKKYLTNYAELKKLYQIAMRLEGLKKNISTHAAGVVISSVPLDEVIPIYHNGEELITGIPMEYLEKLGLLKMDFLGLKNLSFMADVLKYIPSLKLKDIPLNDKRVFDLFNRGDVDGIFQFETGAMRKFLTKFKIDTFADLIASLALVRPGPKDHIDLYIKRKKGQEPTHYLHPDLEPILKETYGIMIYQEQIMAILVKIGSYTLAEADIVRRAIAKKKESILAEEQEKFVKRAVLNNYSRELVTKIYWEIAKFASYGFNKSHSVSYAILSYQMAYLKVYYYEYFMLATLKDKTTEEIGNALSLLKAKGLKVIKPSILDIKMELTLKDKQIYLPLAFIKNISVELSRKIVDVMGDGFQDYYDFLMKTKNLLTEEQIKALIKAGVFDVWGINHPTLLNNLDIDLNYIMLADGADFIKKPALKEYPDLTKEEKYLEEFEVYGFYCQNHPASKYQGPGFVKINQAVNYLFKRIRLGVLVKKIQTIKTKKGEDMAFLTAGDETGDTEFTVFPRYFSMLKNVQVNDIIIIDGEVTKRFDKWQIIVNNIKKDGEDK